MPVGEFGVHAVGVAAVAEVGLHGGVGVTQPCESAVDVCAVCELVPVRVVLHDADGSPMRESGCAWWPVVDRAAEGVEGRPLAPPTPVKPCKCPRAAAVSAADPGLRGSRRMGDLAAKATQGAKVPPPQRPDSQAARV